MRYGTGSPSEAQAGFKFIAILLPLCLCLPSAGIADVSNTASYKFVGWLGVCFSRRFLCVALSILEFTLSSKPAWTTESDTCLCFPSARIKGVRPHPHPAPNQLSCEPFSLQNLTPLPLVWWYAPISRPWGMEREGEALGHPRLCTLRPAWAM